MVSASDYGTPAIGFSKQNPVHNRLGKWVLEHPWLAGMLSTSDAWVAAAERWSSSTRNWVIAIAAIALLQSALVLGHWAWLDEWQALQIAVQSPNQAALIANLAYEGHPPLWYWILRTAAQILPLLWVLPVTALAIGLVTQGLILFASPFTRSEKLLLALSEPILFEFNTVSRSLTLGCMLVVLCAALWKSRLTWLPIILLPACDFLFGAISIALLLMLWRKPNWSWSAACVWALAGLAAAFTMIPAPDIEPALAPGNPVEAFGQFLVQLGALLFPFQFQGFIPSWKGTSFFLIAPYAGPAFLWFAWRQFADARWARSLFYGFVGVSLATSMAVYTLSTRHLMLIALLLIVLEWILRLQRDRPTSRGFRLWLLAGAVGGVLTAAIALVVPFNTAHIAARDLERLGLLRERLIAFPQDNAHGIPALSGVLVENPSRNCRQSFVRWDTRINAETPLEMMHQLQALRARKGRSYILTNIDLYFVPATLAAPVYRSPRGYDGTRFWVYLIGRDYPRKPAPTTPCVAGLRPFRAIASIAP